MANPTELYPNHRHKTQLYDSASSAFQGLKVGQKINLSSSKYTILDIISKDSGEAVIYKIQDAEYQFALKMYFEFQNEKDEPNAEALKRILKIKSPYILKLHEFGVSKDKFQGKYCYEIADFAQGGDLLSVSNFKEKYASEFIKNSIVPQVFKGIQTLHQNHIFHCDLKPQNVFFWDSAQKKLVIGDYGSAKTFELEKEKDARKTSTVKGTDFYLPPEQARGFISEKNDFYSFGMILLHLIYPKKICDLNDFKRINRQKFRQIIENQFQNQPIIDFDKNHSRLNHLIAGLTLTNVVSRWGAYEVQSWLNGENPEVIYQTKASNQAIFSIDLGDTVIRTEFDLVKFIETDEEWYELLFEDHTGRYLFNKWLTSIRNVEATYEVDKIIKKNQQYQIAFLQDALIRYFRPHRPLVIGQRIYDLVASEDLIFETACYFGKLIKGKFSESELHLYLFQYQNALKYISDFQTRQNLKQTFEKAHQKVFKQAGIYPKFKHKKWLKVALSILTQHQYRELVFDKISKKGIHCHFEENWTEYFQTYGEDLVLKNIEPAQIVEYPNYTAKIDDFDGALSFESEKLFEETIQFIRDWFYEEVHKKIDFEKLKPFLGYENEIILSNSVPANTIYVDVYSIEINTNNLHHHVDYQIILPRVYLDDVRVNTNSLLKNISYSISCVSKEEDEIQRQITEKVQKEFGKKVEVYLKTPNFTGRKTKLIEASHRDLQTDQDTSNILQIIIQIASFIFLFYWLFMHFFL